MAKRTTLCSRVRRPFGQMLALIAHVVKDFGGGKPAHLIVAGVARLRAHSARPRILANPAKKNASQRCLIAHVPVPRRMLLLTLVSSFALDARAGDWPQILGPHRSGAAEYEPALSAWPVNGPQTLWAAKLGSGFAGPVVVRDQVLVFHRVDDNERVECFNVSDGRSRWQTDFPATYRGGVNPDTGPRCVPLIHVDKVYLFGAAGRLHCVNLSDGKPRWSRDVYRDFDGDEGYFGAGSTPIVAGEKLLLNVGGRNSGLVAFDLATGATVWQVTSEKASYSSPTTAKVAGKTWVIFVTRLSTIAVDPMAGAIQFRFPFGQRGPTVNAATPLICDGHLFVSAAYRVGARYARLSDGKAQIIWQNDNVMSSQYSTCVFHQGHLYGTHGREDFANGEFRCVEASSGKLQWKSPGTGVGHVILVNDRMLMLNHEGRLRLARASPDKYQELASASVSTGITRALPALSNGRFYFRDNVGRGGQLHCLKVAASRD